MKKLLILGAGGYGKTVADVAHQLGRYSKIAFLDDTKTGMPGVLGTCGEFLTFADADTEVYPAFGNNTARMNWLETILPQLGVEANCVTARAEEAVANCRETYDIATSRAVARLNILLELTAPFVKVGGFVLAMKGTAAHEELEEAKKAIKTLGLKLEEVREFPVDGTAHTVIVLKR